MIFQLFLIIYFLIGLFLSILYYKYSKNLLGMFLIIIFWPLYFLLSKKEKEKDCDCD